MKTTILDINIRNEQSLSKLWH